MEKIRIKDPIVSSTRLSSVDEIKKTLNDESIPLQVRNKIIYNTTSNLVNTLFESKITKDKVEETKESVVAMLDNVIHNEVTIRSMIEVSSYDYYTYTHCVNVAVYCVGLGKELGLSEWELKTLGMGGILHDLGKARIDINIVNKAGKLDNNELMIMRNHPDFGYDILKELDEQDPIILSMVRHHHEKLDGTGYPDRLGDKDLDLYTRIVAISDIFDALNTQRSYKPALKTFDALSLMRKNMNGELDNKLLDAFVIMMGKE